MYSNIFIILITANLIFSIGCKKSPLLCSDEKDCAMNICECDRKEKVVIDTTIQNKWIFQSFENMSGSREYPPNNLAEMNVDFSDSTIINVKGQNNTCGGNYKLYQNNCLEVTQLMCTEIGGTKEQIEWERKYFKAFSSMECYNLTGNALKIYFKNNNNYEILNFRK